MLKSYRYPRFEYRKPDELRGVAATAEAAQAVVNRRPVVIVGAGPVGLAAALDCALQGIAVVLIDEDDTVSLGSRGLCYAQRTLQILDRLGVGDAVVDKGVTWNVGRTFFGDDEVFRFNLQPEPGHKRPGMVNLQQYYLEEYLVAACARQGVDLRWKNRVIAVAPGADKVTLNVETPDGVYAIEADWLLVCDGARSPIRRMLGLDIEGRVFRDRFLIADVVMRAQFPSERWFWFDPPFHRNQSVLLHREADDVWRIDFQLGWDADPEEEKKPEKVIPRIQAMLGEQREFELEWVSVYTFQCRRMARFNHGRVLFAGDAAHQVSPFGARGANSGIQDADNLVWKLKLVLHGKAPASLLESYSDERVLAADENILNSTRSTDFITPKSAASRAFRNAVLQLARYHAFAQKLVNSGRLSVPTFYSRSPLNTPLDEPIESSMQPGAPMADAPVELGGRPAWLLDQVGTRFQLMVCADDPNTVDQALLESVANAAIPVEPLIVTPGFATRAGMPVLRDVQGLVAQRYGARNGTALLLRPDQHIAARWPQVDAERVAAAVARATCNV